MKVGAYDPEGRGRIGVFNYGVVNFGDALAPYIVQLLTGRGTYFSSGDLAEVDTPIALIGSIMEDPRIERCHVWGCGYSESDAEIASPLSIHALRGKLSASKHGLDIPIGDPALLLPTLMKDLGLVVKTDRPALIPHFVEFEDCVSAMAGRHDYDIVNMSLKEQTIPQVVDAIRSSPVVFSSSLHGLIVAHAFGVPAFWIRLSDKVLGDGFKYRDYFTSVRAQCLVCLDWDGYRIPTSDIAPGPDGGHAEVSYSMISELMASCPIPR